MPTLRNIVAISVPLGLLTVLAGFLWFFSSRKKPKNGEPPYSKTKQRGQNVSEIKDDTTHSAIVPNSSNNVVNANTLEKQMKELIKTSSKTNVDCLIESTTTDKINPGTECRIPQKAIETTVQNPLEHVQRLDIISVLGNANNNSVTNESNKAENEGKAKEEIVNESCITVSETSQSFACPIQCSLKSHQPGGINQLLEQGPVSNELYVNSSVEVVSDHNCDNVENDANKCSDIVHNETCENILNINELKMQPLPKESPSEVNDLTECVDLTVKVTQNGLKCSVNCQQRENDHAYNRDKTEHVKLTESQNVLNKLVHNELTESLSNKQTENCDNLSEVSNDSGKGGSVDNVLPSQSDEEQLFEFNIPSDMCGLFIGTKGKTIKMICGESGTRIMVKNHPYNRDYQICVIEGTQSAINAACSIIKMKFPSIQFPGIEADTNINPVLMPEIMQLNLPEGVNVDVVVSSIIDGGRIFIQQPTHPTFPSLERLNVYMNQCYFQNGAVPDIPRPIESGVICAAPMLDGWYRAQIIATYDATDEADIKYVDYGGYSRISSSCLKQIRSDFMTLPFEAVECYLANITPLAGELYFSTKATAVLEELTQRKMLNAQIVGRADDGIPYVHIYQIFPNNAVVLVNREMVNRGVVRWVEPMM